MNLDDGRLGEGTREAEEHWGKERENLSEKGGCTRNICHYGNTTGTKLNMEEKKKEKIRNQCKEIKEGEGHEETRKR